VISALTHIARLARAGFVFAREGVFGVVDPSLVPPPGQLALRLARIVERTIAKEENTVHAVLDRDDVLQLRAVCREVLIAPHVQDYAIDLVMATQPGSSQAHDLSNKFIRYGSSPRGAQTLILGGKVRALLDGRYNVSMEDIRALMLPALRHRIILNFEAQADGRTPDDLLEEIAGKLCAK